MRIISDYLSLEIRHFLQGLRFIDYMMKVAKKAVQVYHFFSYPNNCRNTACTFVLGAIIFCDQLNASDWLNFMI
jgi:hypothetical protein